MELTTAKLLFLTLLKASQLTPTNQYSNVGVEVEWDLDNKVLTGTFRIPLQFNVNLVDGTFDINAPDFYQENLI